MPDFVMRLPWGSDWPVCTLAGSSADWLQAAQQLTAHLGEKERRALFFDNAARIYRLEL